MSTILMFVMDLDSLFPCKFTHICRVQIVIILYPKPDKMPQVLSLMTLGKILAKKIVNSLQIWAQTVKAKVVSKGALPISSVIILLQMPEGIISSEISE